MGMEFRGLVWKRVWKMTFFWSEIGWRICGTGRHTPTKNSQEYPPPPYGILSLYLFGHPTVYNKSEEKFLTRASVLFSRKFRCNLKSYESKNSVWFLSPKHFRIRQI